MAESRPEDGGAAFAATAKPDDPALAPTVIGHASPERSGTVTGEPLASEPLTDEHPGRYRRESELGRGGMGRVVLAFDQHLGREIAMKELLAQSAGGSDAAISAGTVARFLREARITGQLEHPGIVPVHELGRRPDGTIYYTMKRIRGRSLAMVLRECRTLEDRLRLIATFRHVCEAVAYAHSRGVVHRDLKPDNVMVGEFGETLVVDWGLAKVRGEGDPRAADEGSARRLVVSGSGGDAAQTIDGHAIGTPSYMSPEQARGDVESIDERSDVWGLGAMLFEILTGRAPYVGTALEVVRRIREEPPPRVRDIEPAAPPELAAIADRALMRDPSSRYPRAQELAAEIAAFQDGAPVRAYEYSAWEQLRRFVRRHRAASIAAAVVLVFAVTASVAITDSWMSEQSARLLAEQRRDEAMQERERAVRSELASQVAVAGALLERAERAFGDADFAAAAIYAAAALVRDPANPDGPAHADLGLSGEEERAARERVIRAFSVYVEAEESRRWVVERRIPSAPGSGATSPDGRTLAMARVPSGLELFDLVTGARREVPGPAIESVLAWIDATRVVVSGGTPGIVDLETGTLVRPLPAASSAALAAGRLALATSGGDVIVLDAASGREIERFPTVHRGIVRVAWDRDGSRLAVTGRNVARIDVWSFPRTAGAMPVAIEIGAWSRAMAFSPDGARLAITANAPEVRIADLSRTPPTTTVLDARGWTSAIAWLADGTLVSADGGEQLVVRRGGDGAIVEILHVPTSSGHRLLGAEDRVIHQPVSGPEGDQPATVFRRLGANEIRRSRRVLEEAVSNLVLDPARNRVVVTTATGLAALDLRRHRLGPPTPIARIPDAAGHPVDLAVAHDGAIAAITTLGAVVLIEPHDAPLRIAIPPRSSAGQPLLGLAFDGSGDMVFAGSPSDGSIRRFRRSTGAELEALPGHRAPVLGLTLSRDGRWLASASADGTVRIWDLGRDPPTARVLEGHEGLASHAAFSPDGSRVACADGRGAVRFFEVATARLLSTARPHDRWINRIVWSRDGRRIVTASDDGTVRLLGGDGQDVLRILRTGGTAIRAEISEDGTDLVVHDGRAVIRAPAEPGFSMRDPEALLRDAERRAGVRLDGFELVPVP